MWWLFLNEKATWLHRFCKQQNRKCRNSAGSAVRRGLHAEDGVS
jgi:hypothetical protein